MKTFWVVLITALVAAAVAAGGTYYFFDKQAVKDRSNLQSQIDRLESEIESKNSLNSDNSQADDLDEAASVAKTPKQVVDEFWTGYIDIDNVTETYLRNTTLLTADLKTRLMTDNNGVVGANAVSCAQDMPPSFTSVQKSVSGSTAFVTVTENFEPNITINVGLTLSNNNWLISSIACPTS